MPAADRPLRGSRAASAELTEKKAKPSFKQVWPEIKALIMPRRGLLAVAFLLMLINRAVGLVMPGLFQPFIDKVMNKHELGVLPWIVGAALAATCVQALTSYALTQLLSKSGQRLISDLRKQVQAHIGRLSVSFYDENRTGTLVSRIMNDVEGIRNIVGTGVVDFVGGILTAILAFVWLLHTSVSMTMLTFAFLFCFALLMQRAFKTIRPIFR
jgi:subfamily B ATP-binding cassette protein MsbA